MATLADIWSNHSLLILDIVGTILGLWYLWLEYHASIALWLVGVLMPALYLFTYYEAGLYADFGLQIYYLLAALYGWFAWKNKPKQEKAITNVPVRIFVSCMIVFLIGWIIIYEVLIHFTDSTVPICDALINSLSIVGLWMLSRKYVEQWLVWLVVDAISCVLYAYKGIPFTAGLYGLYTFIAVFGFRKWRKMMRENA